MLFFEISQSQAIDATAWGLAWAGALQSVELVALHRTWRTNGAWDWRWLQDVELATPRLRRRVCLALLAWPGFALVVATRLAACVCLPFDSTAWSAAWLAVTTLLIAYRWRGLFTGGSDVMTMQVALACWGMRLAASHDEGQRIALLYLALQSTLSYLVAGLAKVRVASWHDGRALLFFLHHHPLSRGASLAKWLQQRQLVRVCAWAVMGFEFSAPLVWVVPGYAAIFVALAVGFHLVNGVAFGLHRFIWIWAATYPALLWAAGAAAAAAAAPSLVR